MRLRKVINRVYHGTTYYRWLLSVSPKDVRQLGWVDGQPLEAVVRGGTLTIAPAVRPRGPTRGRQTEALEDSARERTVSARRSSE